jgi:hypothetical protein
MVVKYISPATVLILPLLMAVSGNAFACPTNGGAASESRLEAPTGSGDASGLATVGLYVSLPTDPPPTDNNLYDFFKACGYNYLEFCEAGFHTRPDLFPDYYQAFSKAINAAHGKGFRVGVDLLAGVRQWTGSDKSGFAGVFSPRDQSDLKQRLDYLERALKHLQNADSFILIAGDPGGDPKGRSDVNDCLEFAREVHDIVKREAPHASFAMNLWAIAEWGGFPPTRSLRFWRQEVNLSRIVETAPNFLGPDFGVTFPLHNYYRSLTLACYAAANLRSEPYPRTNDIELLRARGVKPLLGWPYFLVDEADDGFITPNNVDSGGQSSVETRYIRALIDHAQTLGLDGLVGNAIFFQAEVLNTYAFGQMCHDPGLTPEQVIDRFAGVMADEQSRGVLARVIRYVENNSNWQVSLPPTDRLKNFDTPDMASASVALDLLVQVKPCAHPAIPLPEAPGRYLGRLKKRLLTIASGNIGGTSRIRKSN